MTFVFRDEYSFEWPVTVQMPGEDTPRSFTGHFVLTDDASFFDPVEAATRAAALQAEIAKLAEVFVGWHGIQTEQGDDLPVSTGALYKLLAITPVRLAVLRAYTDAVYLGREREKN